MEEGDRYLTTLYPTYGAGDVVGCGVNFESRSVYFTKNGVRLGDEDDGGVAFHMIETAPLFPVIGVGSEGMEVSGDGGDFVYGS